MEWPCSLSPLLWDHSIPERAFSISLEAAEMPSEPTWVDIQGEQERILYC